MACERIPVRTYKEFKDCKEYKDFAKCENCIYDTVKKIIQEQKEAKQYLECDTCESPLFAQIFNTRPVTFYLSNGKPFEVPIPNKDCDDTTVFRIEKLNGDCVTLRLIKRVNGCYVCTDYTAILNLCCVCGLQCFPPICCEECQRGCGY